MIRILAIIFCILLSSHSVAEEGEAPPLNPKQAIKISIVGTSSYGDVKFIVDGIKRSGQVNKLVTSLSGRGLVELSGAFIGDPETVISDLQNLSQDRFEFEVTQREPILLLTLRKLGI